MLFPGTHYCGLFAPDFPKEPTDQVDACCRTHDLQSNNRNINTFDSDLQLLDCLNHADILNKYILIISNIFKGKLISHALTNTYSHQMPQSDKRLRKESEDDAVQ